MNMKKVGLVVAGAGALYLLTKKSGPVFYDASGKSVLAALSGDTITFDVPGYSRVWMSQLKDKVLNYDGPFNLPMPPYEFKENDVGTYDIAVYAIDANDVKGELIGQTSFIVYPASAYS